LQSEIDKAHFVRPVVFAIPDPYIECWYIADMVALWKTLGTKPQNVPTTKQKGDRTFCKRLLKEACNKAGIESKGIEYGKAIAANLSLAQTSRNHPAFKAFLEDARRELQTAWRALL